MKNKVLIIGQAPPAKKQQKPYDSTVLYDWLAEVGEDGSNCEFDAVYDKFPGFDSNGGHKKPTKKQMEDYWERELEKKCWFTKYIILVGSAAKNFVLKKCGLEPSEFKWGDSMSVLYSNKDIEVTTMGVIHAKDGGKHTSTKWKSFGILPHPSKRNTLLHKQREKEIKSIFEQFFK